MKRILVKPPQHVVYVPVDFQEDSWQQRLIEAGYNRHGKTVFIGEGLTMYLSLEAVNAILKFVLQHAGDGSSIVFDYFPSSVADGTCSLKEIKRLDPFVKKTGEPFTFGIDSEMIEDFLSKRGFVDIVNTTSETLHQLYFTGSNKKRHVSRAFACVSATVEKNKNKNS
jgi:methyltransferase (TIGR00027 family)